MGVNKRIQTRFEQLIAKSENLLNAEGNISYQFTGWGISCLDLLKGIFGENSNQYKTFKDYYQFGVEAYAAEALEQCVSILSYAREDYIFGFPLNLESLLKAQLGDDLLEDAKQLLDGNQKDIACFISGVALELAIKDLCNQNQINFNRKTTQESLNIELRKAGVYNESMRKQVSAWIGRRNHAAHGEWDEYDHGDVNDLINGVERFIGTYLS